MKADYSVHDKQYQEARAKGWNGWGGNERMAHERIWIERLFSYAEIPTAGEVLELGYGNCLHCILEPDRKTFLSNVHRLLKTNGVFFVYSKCSSSASDEVIELEGKPYRYAPSRENLHIELEAAGFEIRKSDFYWKEIGEQSHCSVHLTKR